MVDWQFIYSLEDDPKGRACKGYWPGGLSGVTVADGVDLGQMSSAELLTLPNELQDKLLPYVGIFGQKSQLLLNGTPLILTDAECELIEKPKRLQMLGALAKRFEQDSGVAFSGIPSAAQTVLMSVSWQYGSVWVRCPKFWDAACKCDWPAVIAELRDFSDKYTTRRNAEATYLENHLSVEGVQA